MRRLVINMWGAPGSGKSTAAAYIYAQLKLQGVNVELVREYVKEQIWYGKDHEWVKKNQMKVLRKQLKRHYKTAADVIITDCPPQLCCFYASKYSPEVEDLCRQTCTAWGVYGPQDDQNLHFWCESDLGFNESSRFQTEAESHALSKEMRDWAFCLRGPMTTVRKGDYSDALSEIHKAFVRFESRSQELAKFKEGR